MERRKFLKRLLADTKQFCTLKKEESRERHDKTERRQFRKDCWLTGICIVKRTEVEKKEMTRQREDSKKQIAG
jgi:hypothetical protein